MPVVMHHCTIRSALQFSCDALYNLCMDVSKIAFTEDPRLAATERVRVIAANLTVMTRHREGLRALTEILDLAGMDRVPHWQVVSFSQYVTRRKRGPSRSDRLSNAVEPLRAILDHLVAANKSTSGDDYPPSKMERILEKMILEMSDLKFPKYYTTREELASEDV